jgi:hypothetical protein
MPILVVEIEYNEPTDPYWMNPDNIKMCLEKECTNTKFDVRWHEDGNPWSRLGPYHIISLALENKVFEALGAASMCWSPRPGDMIFKSEEANTIGCKLCEDIRRYFDYEHYYDIPEDKELPDQERNINLE